MGGDAFPPTEILTDFPSSVILRREAKMRYHEFLALIIEDGIEAVRQDYVRPDQNQKRDGSIKGFEECRRLDPIRLAALLSEAHATTNCKYREQAMDYWYWRCRETEIAWVCNVVSASLINQGLPPISDCTARGMIRAAEILGVAPTTTPPKGH